MKIVFGPTLLLIAGPRVIDAFAPPQSPLIASRSSNVGVSVNREQSKPIYMVKYEDLVEKMPTETVIDAVEKAPSGKVIASDVAASAGVSLSQARRDLTALASLTKGDIAVSNDGELMYTFPSGLRGVLSSNSAKYKAIAQYEKVKPVLFYLVRVSFGVVLLTSLVAIFSTIFFINSSSSSDDDRRRDDRGGGGMGFGGSYFWGPSPLDFFYYRPYYGYYSPMPGEAYRDPEEMGFLESTFSYIFGDGNPNQNIEEKRLSLVASMIRINNGAVTAEQLAPFCDDVPEVSNDDSTYVDESFVLPIVTQLGGEPRVTEDGDIVYLFPELQLSASSSKQLSSASSSSMILKRAGLKSDATSGEIKTLLQLNGISSRGALEKRDLLNILEDALPPMTESEEEDTFDEDPTMLQEKKFEFSLASDTNKFLAGGLGVVNLGGALYLGSLFTKYAMYGVQLPSYFGVVQAFYPGLLAYAVLYNVIPLVRRFRIKNKNNKISDRNRKRRLWKTALAAGKNGVGRVARKLKAAARFGTKMKQLGSKDVFYDTSKPLNEQEKKIKQQALDDFDKLLGDS